MTGELKRYDGQLWWITDAFAREDTCGYCEQRFLPMDVAVVMWKQGDDGRTWITRIHQEPCAQHLMTEGILDKRSDNGR